MSGKAVYAHPYSTLDGALFMARHTDISKNQQAVAAGLTVRPFHATVLDRQGAQLLTMAPIRVLDTVHVTGFNNRN